MRKGIALSVSILIVTSAGYGLLSRHLTSQDTSFSGYLSGLMLNFWGGENDQLIRVNLHNHAITLYQHGVLYKAAQIAGAGNPYNSTATPTGRFRILSKDKWHISNLSGVIMPLSMRFFEGYYFHDIPLTPDGRIINTKYSHGCIRLPTALAKEMFDWTNVGAYVEVYNASLAREEHSEKVYRLNEDGTRQHIVSQAAFTAHGYHWEDVAVVPDLELSGLIVGPALQ